MILLQQGQFALRSITSSDVHEEDCGNDTRLIHTWYHTLLKVLSIHIYLVHERNKLPVSRTYYCIHFPVQQTTRSEIGHFCVSSFSGLATNTLNVVVVVVVVVPDIMYGHTYSKCMDQTCKVAHPARGQLNRENELFPVRVRA